VPLSIPRDRFATCVTSFRLGLIGSGTQSRHCFGLVGKSLLLQLIVKRVKLVEKYG
jgi:hypothetical protein